MEPEGFNLKSLKFFFLEINCHRLSDSMARACGEAGVSTADCFATECANASAATLESTLGRLEVDRCYL